MSALSRFAQLALTSLSLGGMLFAAGCTCGSGPYQGDYFDGDRPGSMKAYKFVESEKADPKVVGCADGQREGFADMAKNPRVAGCMGKWKEGKSLRDKPTGKACGDDGAVCGVPADVCSEGWHVCGMEGKADDMKTRTTQEECDAAGPGRFNAAMSHSPTDEIDPCPRITKNTDLPCVQAGIGSEPICCGNDCLYGKCKDAVWKGKTRISRGTTEGCGAMTSERNGGVMCCYDGEDAPAASAKPAAGAEGAAAEGAAAEGAAAEGAAAEGAAAEGEAKAEGAAKGEAKAEGAAKVEAKVEGAAKVEGEAKVEGDAAKK